MSEKPISIQIEYKLTDQGAVITKIHGRAAELRIPESIAGHPVTAIAQKAFAVKTDAPEAKAGEERSAALSFVTEAEAVQEEGEALKRVFLPDTVKTIGESAFCGCTALERLSLPAGLEEISERMLDSCESLEQLTVPAQVRIIGGYAFYNCRRLKALQLPETVERIGRYAFYNCRRLERINIPLAAVQLSMGLFLNCDALKYLTFGRCRHIADLISVLNHELHLTIGFPQEDGEVKTSRLLIPDFQYEYIEDTPARQFHQVNYGTGHIFRQCIGNSEIDFRRYDEIFYLTRREDAAVTVLLLALYRLEYPYRLEEKRKETYLEYIREHLLWAAEHLMDEKKEDYIRLFADWGLLTAENMPELLTLAQAKGKTGLLSFLMDYQHRNFAPAKKKKTFAL